MVEYIVGPVLALLLGMKFSDYKSKEQAKIIEELKAKIEAVEQQEQEIPKKLVATITPIAKAVQRLNEQVGL